MCRHREAGSLLFLQPEKIQGQWDAVDEGGHPTPSKDKRRDKILTVLTLVNCARLIQNGDFVSFSALKTLLVEMPTSPNTNY